MKADQNHPPKTSGLSERQMAAIIEQCHLLVTQGAKGDQLNVVLGGKGQLYINRFIRIRDDKAGFDHG